MRLLKVGSAAVAVAALAGCGGGGGGGSNANCTETGVSSAYACQSGSTEPLYTYQWALKLAGSFFSAYSTTTGGSDLNVESVHQSGAKGQGVRVLVLDDGLETSHEDLAANVDSGMSYNFLNSTSNPSPTGSQQAHGTGVAGIIAAAQNGKGVMGIAPRVTLGGGNYLMVNPTTQQVLDAYGGASWSNQADVVNASYGTNPTSPPQYPDASVPANLTAIRNVFPTLRSGKGLVFVKASGNEFWSYGSGGTYRDCPTGVQGVISCEVPAHDIETLEPNVITVAAATADAYRASYSNVGSVNWVTGLAGEYPGNNSNTGGTYGQNSGPVIFTTDQIGCTNGYSKTASTVNDFLRGITTRNGVAENANCDYGMLNGTSAATPTVAGVISLMLQANPSLTWRDVREILRATSRKIQSAFGTGGPSGNRAKLIDLTSTTGSFTSTAVGTASDLQDNATSARVEYGWQTNGAGYEYSNAFGFGLVNAAAAVAQAKATTTYRSASISLPSFTSVPNTPLTSLSYGRVTRLTTINLAGATGQVDAFQVRMSGPLCVGSVGVFVRSPAGTVSALSVPYNIYYKTGNASVTDYTLSSYAFFGESKAGNWEVFLVSGTPITGGGTGTCTAAPSGASPLTVQYRIIDRV